MPNQLTIRSTHISLGVSPRPFLCPKTRYLLSGIHKGSAILGSMWYSPQPVMRHNARDRICREACMGLSCFPRIHQPVHSRWWGLRAGSRQALPFVFWPLKSKILPMCKKQSLKMNHIQMQRKRERQQKEDKSLKFYLGETQVSFLERASRWIQELIPECRAHFFPCPEPLSSLSHGTISILLFTFTLFSRAIQKANR